MWEKIAIMAFNAFLWLLGAITRYFYNILADNEKDFNISIFSFSLFVWMWVGILVWEFIPDNNYADWIKILSGIISFEIVESLTKKWSAIIKEAIKKTIK